MAKITVNNMVNTGLDVQGLIDQLIKIKSIPIDDIKAQNTDYQDRLKKLGEFMDLLKKLQDSAKSLYDYRSPFEEMLAKSSDESALTATVQRGTEASNRKITIIQTALSQRISSDALQTDMKIDKTSFTIKVGDTVKRVTFNGGSLADFVKAMQQQVGDAISVNLVYKDKNTAYITMESKKEGVKNSISISDDGKELFDKLGMFTYAGKFENTLKTENTFVLNKDQNKVVSLQGLNATTGTVKVTFDAEKQPVQIPKPTTVNLTDDQGSTNPVTIDNSTLYPDQINANQVIDTSSVVQGPLKIKVTGTTGEKIIDVDASKNGFELDKNALGIGDITKIEFVNPSSDTWTVKNLKVVNVNTSEGYVPKHVLQEGRNAILTVDGITVEKETNSVDDIIKGVTLNLKKPTDKEVTLSIEPNTDYIKEQLITFVGNYNNVIDFITKETAIDTAGKKASGMFAGDTTMMMLHNTMQRIMNSAYNTSDLFTHLAQLGITTGKIGSSPTQRGGFLEIDEQALDKAIKNDPDRVKKLFGYDSDNDRIPDNGLAFKLFETIKGMTNINDGSIKRQTDFYNLLISNNDKKVETLERQLETYRDNLIFKFSVMSNMISQLKSQGQYFTANMGGQNNNNG